MPLDPYGGHAAPAGSDYVAFNRGYRSSSGYRRPPGRTTKFLSGFQQAVNPISAIETMVNTPFSQWPRTMQLRDQDVEYWRRLGPQMYKDVQTPEGLGGVLAMALGRKPKFRVERFEVGQHLPEEMPLPYGMTGVREHPIIPNRLMLYDDANLVPQGKLRFQAIDQPFREATDQRVRQAMAQEGLEPGGPRLAGSFTYNNAIPASEHTPYYPVYGGTAYVHPEYRQTSAMNVLSQAFMRDVVKGQPFETHFANKRLALVAKRLMEREGWRTRGIGTAKATLFMPPGWYPTRRSPTPQRRATERPWDIPARQGRLSHERAWSDAEYEEFMEWFRQYRERNQLPPEY